MNAAKKFTSVLPPKSATASFTAIKEIINMGWIDIPPEKAFNGNAAPGDFLEHLLGGERNNRDSPDLNDWEVKFHGGNALLTLFHKEPEPKGVIRFMVDEYGWEDDQKRISFRHTISGRSDRGFVVKNDTDRIVIRNEIKDAIVPFWKHNKIMNCLGGKLRRLIVVEGEYLKRERKVIYRRATAYWDVDFDGFFSALEQGIVCVDFDARTKDNRGSAIRNHGTKFRIKIANIGSIYTYKTKIT